MKKLISYVIVFTMMLSLMPSIAFAASSQITEGNFVATVKDGKATITKYKGKTEKTITVPANIKGYPVMTVDAFAIADADYAETIVFSEGIENLNYQCVAACDALKTIKVPSTAIFDVPDYNGSFFGVSPTPVFYEAGLNVEKVEVNKGNKYVISKNGVIYSKDMKTLLFYPPAKKDKVYTIPNGVIAIGDHACSMNGYLKEVKMPNTVKYIDYWAFMDSNFEKINISTNCKLIGQFAFQNTGIKSLHIPASVSTIVDGAFASTEKLSTITVDKANKRFKVIDGVLMDGTAIVLYPANSPKESYSVPKNVEVIAQSAFEAASNLKEIKFNGKLKEIHYSAFYGCEGLTDVVLPNSLKYIGDTAFMNCNNLVSITIPASVTEIGSDILANDFGAIIYAKEGSVAYKYAKANNIGVLQPGATSFAGKRSNNIYWEIKNNVITISGNGELRYKYYSDGIPREPWTPYVKMIREVIIEEGITYLDTYIFLDSNTEALTVPSSMEYVDIHFGKKCKSITILNADCDIYYTGDLSESCMIYGLEGSTAEEFAEELGLKFETVEYTQEHDFGNWITDSEATCKKTGERHRVCNTCGEVETKVIPVSIHETVKTDIVKATPTKAGKMVAKCSCGKIMKTTAIKKVSKITLSKTSVTFTGKEIAAPVVRVKNSVNGILAKSNYTVTAPKNKLKKIGRYTYTVTLNGKKFEGKKKLTFEIKPETTSLKTPAGSNDAVTVKWNKGKKAQVSGYEVMLATNKGFTKNKRSILIDKYSKTSKKVEGLKDDKTYYIKIRTYKNVNGTKIYSVWSSYKTVKTK